MPTKAMPKLLIIKPITAMPKSFAEPVCDNDLRLLACLSAIKAILSGTGCAVFAEIFTAGLADTFLASAVLFCRESADLAAISVNLTLSLVWVTGYYDLASADF